MRTGVPGGPCCPLQPGRRRVDGCGRLQAFLPPTVIACGRGDKQLAINMQTCSFELDTTRQFEKSETQLQNKNQGKYRLVVLSFCAKVPTRLCSPSDGWGCWTRVDYPSALSVACYSSLREADAEAEREAILTQRLPIHTEVTVLSEKRFYTPPATVIGMGCNTRKRGLETDVRRSPAHAPQTPRRAARPLSQGRWRLTRAGGHRRQALLGKRRSSPPARQCTQHTTQRQTAYSCTKQHLTCHSDTLFLL